MYAANFDYYRPTTLPEAVKLLQELPDARVLAGGHSLLPLMKLRLAAPAALVDIGRIGDLSGISVANGAVKIGALTTHAAIGSSADIQQVCPVLAEAALQIGDTQVRNRGTIGGSVAHADPGADYPTVLVALNATMNVVGPNGNRDVSASRFFTDLFTTALQPGEILSSVTIPASPPRTGAAYLKHRHPASGYAVVGVAALLSLGTTVIQEAAIVVGGVTGKPTRCAAAESVIQGGQLGDTAISSAANAIPRALMDPMGDLYASGPYRVHLATVMARDALRLAAERVGS
jgi:aerobic carbon-monoxide dehydrogenase medium subunit